MIVLSDLFQLACLGEYLSIAHHFTVVMQMDRPADFRFGVSVSLPRLIIVCPYLHRYLRIRFCTQFAGPVLTTPDVALIL